MNERRITLAGLAISMITNVAPLTPAIANHNGYYHGKTWRDSQGRIRCRLPDATVGFLISVRTPAEANKPMEGAETRITGLDLAAIPETQIDREPARPRQRCRPAAG